MSVHDELVRRRAERDTLFTRIVELLRADPRIVAAWLTGSLGRDDGDDLSDLDFWIVVRDDAMAAVADARQEFVARLGDPILIQEVPHNAPSGGAFLLVFYDSAAGLQEVDWHWQPQSAARLPPNVRLLFDHVGIQPAEPALPLTDTERRAFLTDRVIFFWAMAPIAARKIARGQPRAALRLIEMMARALDELRWACGQRDTPPLPEDRVPAPPPVQPAEQLATLRALARSVELLTTTITEQGGAIPLAAIPRVYDFYDFTERLIAEQRQSDYAPGPGSASSQS